MRQKPVKEKERGRPIDPGKKNLILETTLHLLAECGFEKITMDKIAKEAKVSKASIYRRWDSKEELVLDSVKLINPFESSINLQEILNSQLALRDQLVHLLNSIFLNNNEMHEYYLTVLNAALPHTHMGDQQLHEEFIINIQKAFKTILKPFIRTEQLEKKVTILSDLVPALISNQVLLIRRKITRHYIEEIVDEVIMPIINNTR
ncbi:TetR/AcrR family transcriptional regulator [Metabacillus niabensis]|uniref:TetR/AcrR family transcriptional regulator n=1 Tax=Metabacillus niabensis TaxID=324854 RepID=UPI0039A1AD13